ncbi:unnamed protein product [Coffea canephora]|uniref:Piwi domain-containing protein n=1 Tax=Coffea canephora TaxID=49390 RepID=A0A068UET0_COFCA|nr:unnamed protein product [Coffea canephora]
MSGRGRGRGGGGPGGGGGGRGSYSPAFGRSRGRGRGRDGGRGSSSGYNAPPPQPAGASAAGSSSSASTISRELEQKLTFQASSSGSEVPVQRPGEQAVTEERKLPPASSKATRFPQRPGFGTVGQKCVVRANHFLVGVADRDLHHYDVSITPEVSSKKVCRDVMRELVKSHKLSHLGNRALAYDGKKNVYAAGPLPFSSKEFIIKLSDKGDGPKREREFKVSIKFASKADLHHLQQFLRSEQLDVPQETIQALDVVLRESPSNNYTVVGRSFFHPTLGGRGDLGDGVEYWKGFYQSLRPTQMGLSLNIDVSATAFYEPISVLDFIAKYLNIRDLTRLSDQDCIKVKKALTRLRVQHTYLGHVRRYRISGISDKPTNKLTFVCDGIDVTVVQYFAEKYKIVLRHAALPALQSGSAYLPMEVCTIVEGQKYSKKLNDRQVTALLRATCQRPREREQSIRDMVMRNNYNNDQLVHQEFGIQVRPELTSVEARVLPPPTLKYHATGGEPRVNPRVGQWNMINKKMVNGGKVDSWACVSFSRNLDASRFCEDLIRMCSSKGMVFASGPVLPIQSAHPGQIEKTLFDIHANATARLRDRAVKYLQLLIIILPDLSGSYPKIKRVCETELGIVSQCCQPRHVKRPNNQYLENVALKINVKVGGTNAVLEQAVQKKIPFLTDRPTIIFGADVTHPQPGEDSSPSIAAVVASMDWPEATKYRGLVSAQHHRVEIIQDLYNCYEDPKRGMVHGGMIRELLRAFWSSTRLKPERIIFYRDGVSEGQFNQVLLEEMDAIRKACASLQQDYLPRVTFVVVQKRHHTRLFPANHGDRNLTDRSGNILPGTVVETKICHPTEFDFYLCSHAGIQGTSRPTHYHVLFDENGFTADALQTLTNNLCYTYARCTKSVSIVPPAYYAHLAAFRARYYMEGEYSDGGSSSGGRATREQRAELRQLPAIKDNVKDVMFYC